MALEALPAETTSTTTPSAPPPAPRPVTMHLGRHDNAPTGHPPPPPPPLPLASSPMPAAMAASMTRRSSPPPPPPAHAPRVFPTPSLLPRASGVPRGTPFERGTHTHSLLSRTSLTRTYSTRFSKPRILPEGATSKKHAGVLLPSPTAPHAQQGKHQPLFDTSLFESAQPVFMGTASPKKAAQLSDLTEHQADLHPKVPSSPRHPLIAASAAGEDVGQTDMPVINTGLAARHSTTHGASSSRSPTSCVPLPNSATSVGTGTHSPRMSPRHAFSCEPSADRRTRTMSSSSASSTTAAHAVSIPSRSASSSRRRGSAVDRVVAESDDDLMSPLVGPTSSAHVLSMPGPAPLSSNLADLSPFQATSALLPFGHFDLVGNAFVDSALPLIITTGEVAPLPPAAKPLNKKRSSRRAPRAGSMRKRRRIRRKIGSGSLRLRGRRTLRANILIHPNYNPNSPSTDYLDGNSSSSSNITSSSPHTHHHGYISSDSSSTPNLSSSSSSSPETSPSFMVPSLSNSLDTTSPYSQPVRKRQRTESYSVASTASHSTHLPPFELGAPLLDVFAAEQHERQQELFLDDMPLDVMTHAFSWFLLEEVARVLPVSKHIRDIGQAVLARSRAFDDMGFPLDSKSALQTLSRAGACRLRKLVLLTRGTDRKVICNLFTNSPTLRYVEIDSWMLTEQMIPLLARTKLEVLNVSGPSVPHVVRALRGLTGLRALFLNLSLFSERDECRLARATCNVIAACPQLRVVGTSFSLLHCAKASVRLPRVTHAILPSLSRMLGHVMPNLEELCVWYPYERGALSPAKFLDRLTSLKSLTTLHLCFASVPRPKQIRDLFTHIEDHMPTLRALVCSIDAPMVAAFTETVEYARLGGTTAAGNSAPLLSGTNSWMSFLSTDNRGSGSSSIDNGVSSSSSLLPPSRRAGAGSGSNRCSKALLLCPKLTVRVDHIDNIVARLCQRGGIDMERSRGGVV